MSNGVGKRSIWKEKPILLLTYLTVKHKTHKLEYIGKTRKKLF